MTVRRWSCETATLQILHRPGHSPSDTVFWDERAPDPDRRRPPDQAHLLQPADLPAAGAGDGPRPGGGRPQALVVTYIESLRKTSEMPAEIVLSGHGEPITDHVALIDERLEFHRRRAERSTS